MNLLRATIIETHCYPFMWKVQKITTSNNTTNIGFKNEFFPDIATAKQFVKKYVTHHQLGKKVFFIVEYLNV